MCFDLVFPEADPKTSVLVQVIKWGLQGTIVGEQSTWDREEKAANGWDIIQ